MIKYFHELTEEEFKSLIKPGYTYADLAKDYPQPSWCDYNGATDGDMGCWSLMSFIIKDKSSCYNCDHVIKDKSC